MFRICMGPGIDSETSPVKAYQCLQASINRLHQCIKRPFKILDMVFILRTREGKADKTTPLWHITEKLLVLRPMEDLLPRRLVEDPPSQVPAGDLLSLCLAEDLLSQVLTEDLLLQVLTEDLPSQVLVVPLLFQRLAPRLLGWSLVFATGYYQLLVYPLGLKAIHHIKYPQQC